VQIKGVDISIKGLPIGLDGLSGKMFDGGVHVQVTLGVTLLHPLRVMFGVFARQKRILRGHFVVTAPSWILHQVDIGCILAMQPNR
jgi:hypothetical protein